MVPCVRKCAWLYVHACMPARVRAGLNRNVGSAHPQSALPRLQSHLKDGVEYYSVFDLADAYKRILTRASPLGSLKAEINHLAKAVEYESDRVEPIDVIALLHMTTAHNVSVSTA